MEKPNPIFTTTFDHCRDNFFSGKKYEVMGELMGFITRPTDLPTPKECGLMKIRTKELLPQTNTVVYYWNYGRVWEFYGMIENGNEDQLSALEKLLDKMEAENHSG